MKTNASTFLIALLAIAISAQAKPLKVFILAGQSNMQGHAKIETFDYIGDDPATAPLLKQMRGADGKPAVCKHVWISYFTGSEKDTADGAPQRVDGFMSASTAAGLGIAPKMDVLGVPVVSVG